MPEQSPARPPGTAVVSDAAEHNRIHYLRWLYRHNTTQRAAWTTVCAAVTATSYTTLPPTGAPHTIASLVLGAATLALAANTAHWARTTNTGTATLREHHHCTDRTRTHWNPRHGLTPQPATLTHDPDEHHRLHDTITALTRTARWFDLLAAAIVIVTALLTGKALSLHTTGYLTVAATTLALAVLMLTSFRLSARAHRRCLHALHGCTHPHPRPH